MAQTLTITDGTVTVNLISAKVDYQVLTGGYNFSDPDESQIWRSSQFDEGESLVSSRPKNITQEFEISVYGSTHDAIATNLQKIRTLASESREFEITRWQTTPVYLTDKTKDETNTRYSIVKDIRIPKGSGLHSDMFDRNKAIPRLTLIVVREPYWRSTIPLTLPTALTLSAPQTPGTQADATEQFVANFRDTFALTHQYNYDDSLTAFSANQIASTSFSYFVVSGSTPALNDICYFGSTDGPFKFVVLSIGVAGGFTATITWEWYNGTSWVSTAGGIRENQSFIITGRRLVVVDTPTGWATVAINGVTAYWIRARISAFTSWTTSPTQSGQVVYNPRDSYISIANTQIDGDEDALAMMLLSKYQNTTNAIRFVAMGLKSRGLDDFTSRLNAGGNNPTGWSEVLGTDTSEVADILAPNGSHALCTFATDQNMTSRVTLTQATNSRAANFTGEYHAYVRCQQIGGSAGAVSARLAYGDGSANFHAGTAILTSADAGIELVSLGRLSIFPQRVLASGETTTAFNLYLQFSATSATPDVRIYDLILIPIDEWSFVAASDSAIISSSLPGINAVGARLEIDAGLIRRGSTVKQEQSSNRIQYSIESRGTLPKLPPDKAFQIHFLFSDFTTSSGFYESDNCLGGSWKVYVHERWAFMRGSE